MKSSRIQGEGLTPSQFLKLLNQLQLSKETRRLVGLDDPAKKALSNLIHYLTREKQGLVSIAKLREALKQKATDKPLPQENIAEAVELQRKISMKWKDS